MPSDDMDEVIQALKNEIVDLRDKLTQVAIEHLRHSGELTAYWVAIAALLEYPDREALKQALPSMLARVESFYVNSDSVIDEQVHGLQDAQASILKALITSRSADQETVRTSTH